MCVCVCVATFDGTIQQSTNQQALAHMNVSATAACVETLFRVIDSDKSGAIDFNEFVSSIMNPEGKKADIAVRRALEQVSAVSVCCGGISSFALLSPRWSVFCFIAQARARARDAVYRF